MGGRDDARAPTLQCCVCEENPLPSALSPPFPTDRRTSSVARSRSLAQSIADAPPAHSIDTTPPRFISFRFVSTRFTVKEIEQHLRHRRRRNFISKSQIVLQSTFVRLVKPQFGNTKLSDILTRADKLRIPLKKERNISTRCVSTVL